MLKFTNINLAKRFFERGAFFAFAFVMAFASLVTVVLPSHTSAATLTSRSVVISTSQPSATGATYRFNFTTPGSTAIQSMSFMFCTQPLGTCTLPTGMNVGYTTASTNATQTFSQATAFAEYSGADTGGCTGQSAGGSSATTYCVTRTQATAETAAAKSIQIDAVTNPSIPSGNNTSVYVRISTYSDTAFATGVDDGTVAASIVNQLTVSGRVQERLVFCVFALDNAAGSNATAGTAATNYPTDCSASEASASSNVDIGIIDNNAVVQSPVANNPPTSTGNDRFAAAMVNTNASSGVLVSYYASAATSGTNQLRSFRVPGASCDAIASTLTDQCFVSAPVTGSTITTGSEMFGMQITCIANSAASGHGISGTTANLGAVAGSADGTNGSVNGVYNNASGTAVTDTGNCEVSSGNATYAWNDTGTAANLVSSQTVVDDELVKLRFGATASATTPTGSYTVASTFIATPTF